MELAKKTPFNEVLEKIKSFRVAETDLMKEFEISEPTLRSYRKERQISRMSEPKMKLLVLEHGLEVIRDLGYKDKEFDVFKSILFEGRSIVDLINHNASNPLIGKLVITIIEKELGAVKKKPVDIFREKFGYLNDENLETASMECPDLLIQLIGDTELRPSTRGDVLQRLSTGARPDFFDFIYRQLSSEAPHVREGAYYALYSYYISGPKYEYLKTLFQNNIESEKADGVRKTIKSLLSEM